jgi:hypothetical protein
LAGVFTVEGYFTHRVSHRSASGAFKTLAYYTTAGALWDHYDYRRPCNNYWVYDVPFLISGATCQAFAPIGKNGIGCGVNISGLKIT